MNINGKTKIVALFGYPVEHSLSPSMHNPAFAEMELDYCYIALPVHPDDLREAVQAIKIFDMAGANVTVPHKENVMPVLDRIDSEASFIGAVNTIVNQNGKLIGYNTDGRGFMRALEEQDISVEGKKVMLIGTGGGARAISYYLSEQTSELHLFDLDTEKAQRLTDDLLINRKGVLRAEDTSAIGEMDVVINATPLGLKDGDPLPFDISALKPDAIVGDLIYSDTGLQQAARTAGHKTFNGLGMLLWQGVLASELWTGQMPPHETMAKALKETIAG